LSIKILKKSRGGFEKWTFLKMSKIEKPKYFLENTLVLEVCDDNAHKIKKTRYKTSLNFLYIFV